MRKCTKETIPAAVAGIQKAFNSAKWMKRQLNKKILTDEQKKEFKKDLKDALTKDKEIKDNLEKDY